MSELPEDGIHKDVPFATYVAWPAINNGAIRWGMVSPNHMRAALDGRLDSDDTKDRKLGRAIHVMLLESERFHEFILVAGPCCAELKTGKRKGAKCGCDSSFYDGDFWYCGKHIKGRDVQEPTDYVSQDEFKRIERISEVIKEHEVMKLFRRPGWSEVSLLWTEDDVRFKARLDRYSGGENSLIIDIKKMQVGAGDFVQCEKSICSYGWHRQAVHYQHGIDVLTGDSPDYVWVFIEDNEPYDVQVVLMDDETYDIGKWEIKRILAAYKRCQKSGRYHGYIYDAKAELKRGGLPNWKRKEFQGILT